MDQTGTFPKSHPRAVIRVSRPYKEFIEKEALSGIFLIICVLAALIIANIGLFDTYEHWWETKWGVTLGEFKLEKSLHLWINDFLMSIFFLLVGLEIKRELLIGELSTPKRALLPAVAAFGGMVVPALLYVLINPPGSEGIRGWATPMATDIAFALSFVFLLGKRIPSSIRVFLASLAIVDDIGAVLIIAFFYSETIMIGPLIVAVVIIFLLSTLNYLSINRISPYIALGIVLWYTLFLSGIHATIAGVILAFTIPATTKIDYNDFQLISNNLVRKMNDAMALENDLEGRRLKFFQNSVHTLEKACEDVEAPLQKVEHGIAPLVTFLIMPLFAFSNSGVLFEYSTGEIFSSRIVLGVMLGLVIGKPLGIFGFTYVASRLGIVEKPVQLSWLQILGTGFLGGIGFTMAIFIANLAFPVGIFPAGVRVGLAKIGILISSSISAVIGVSLLLYSSKTKSSSI